LRRIASDEPMVLAALMTPTDMPLWGLARSSVRDVLVAAGVATSAPSIDLVVRWLSSCIASPLADVSTQAGLIAASLMLLATGPGPDWQAGHQ
jgi:hypothetical protein